MNDEAIDRDDAGDSFDDDALADALTAQMATYTSPISIIRTAPLLAQAPAAEPAVAEPVAPVYEAPVDREPVHPEPVSQAPGYQEPVNQEPVAEEPVSQAPVPSSEAQSAYQAPAYEAPPFAEPTFTAPVYDGSAFAAVGYGPAPVLAEGETTIDAIERLEGELRRRGFTGETPVITPEALDSHRADTTAAEAPVVEADVPDPAPVDDPASEAAAIPDYVVPAPNLSASYLAAPEIPDYVVPDPDVDSSVIDEPPVYTRAEGAPVEFAAPAPAPAPEPGVEPGVEEAPAAALRDLPPPIGQQPAQLPPVGALDPATADEESAPAPALIPEVVVPQVDPTLAPTGRTDFASMLAPTITEPSSDRSPESSADLADAPPPAPAEAPAAAQPVAPGGSVPPLGSMPPPTPRPSMPEATEPVDLDDDDDAVDEVDRAGAPDVSLLAAPSGAPVAPLGGPLPTAAEPAPTVASDISTAAPTAPPREPVYPLSAPIPTQRVAQDMPALVDERPQNHPVLMVETAGDEPTALDLRAGHATRLFWLWFATTTSVLSLAVGAVLFTLGMSLRQAIVAALAGVALSFLPLGLGTLAGKWSGQPTMIVSRASFGHYGNILPAALAVLSRVFWGGVLLWLLAVSFAEVLTSAGLDLGLGSDVIAALVLFVSSVLVGVVALFGYGFVARLHLVTSIAGAILVAGTVALTYSSLDIDAALATGDGSWVLVLSGAVLVFSVIGLAWVHSSSDIARYQRPGSSGGASMLWATFGATLPPFVLIVWGAMLAASDPVLAEGLATAPLVTLAGLLPAWYPAPLLLAAGVGLMSGAVLTLYSGGFALKALGSRMPRYAATILMTALAVIVAIVFVLLAADARGVVRDAVTTLAVPVAAWAGIVSAEMMIRSRRFHAPSLLVRGGGYPDVRILNLAVFVVLTVIGYGFTSGTLAAFTWQGYLFPLVGIPADSDLAMSDVGVVVALVLALIVTFATAIPTIRRQEAEAITTGAVQTGGVASNILQMDAPRTGAVPAGRHS